MTRLIGLLEGLAGPHDDEVDQRRMMLLAVLCMTIYVAAGFMAVADIASQNWGSLAGTAGMVAAASVTLGLLRQGHGPLGARLFVALQFIIINAVAVGTGGLTSPAFGANSMVIVCAAILLGWRAAIAFWVGMVGCGITLLWISADTTYAFNVAFWAIITFIIGSMVFGVVALAEQSIEDLNRQHGKLGRTLDELERTSITRDNMEQLLGALREYILVTDHDHRVQSVAGAMVAIGGWREADLIGKRITELFDNLDLSHPERSRDVQMHRQDGTRLPVVVTAGRIDTGFVWAASDVSALTSTTLALRQAHDRVRAASAAKSNFLANMSHELRTPLNAIIGYGELLHDEIEEPAAREDLDRIGRAARSLLDLINGVLDLSKVESGRVSLSQAMVSMDDIVQPLISVMEPIVHQRGLTLQVRGEGLQGDPIFTDEIKLRQVLLNLLSNATKFTDHGDIKLQVDRWQRSRLPWVRFVVTDTGIGMATEDLENVFEPFTQAKRVDDGEIRQGTGLGLSICKAYVEMMGGQIYAESTPGQGSKFVVELPAGRFSALTPRTPTAPMPDGVETLTRILVIDDDNDFLEFTGRVLTTPTRQVVTTDDPYRALEWANRFVADLIVLDIAMPVLSGWAFVVRLRNTRSKDTPVLIVSGAGESEVAEALGCSGFLLKPVSPSEFAAKAEGLIAANVGTDSLP